MGDILNVVTVRLKPRRVRVSDLDENMARAWSVCMTYCMYSSH